jgi:hypothetical protein
MLKITAFAIGLVSIVSIATTAEAAPREIYSPSNGRPEILVRESGRYHGRHGGERYHRGEQRRGEYHRGGHHGHHGHHAEREGGHRGQYRFSRNRSRVVYNSRRSDAHGHHGRRHGIVRHAR